MNKILMALYFVAASELGILIFNWMKGMEDWQVRVLYYGAATILGQYLFFRFGMGNLVTQKVDQPMTRVEEHKHTLY